MQEYRIGQKQEGLIKVILNKYNDYILINQNDSGIIEKYTMLVKWIDEKQDSFSKELQELEQKYKGRKVVETREGEDIRIDTEQILELSKFRINMCKEFCEKIDNLLGKDTIKKYFRECYEANEDFIPDESCIIDFFEEITPVMATVFDKRAGQLKNKYSRERNGKHPQNKNKAIKEHNRKR